MSTRANIVIKDSLESLWFYQHGDGYPKGVIPTLEKFLGWIKSGRVRNNANQSSGWLILIGVKQMVDTSCAIHQSGYEFGRNLPFEPGITGASYGWKAGFIEPTGGQHGDIEYLYTVDVERLEVVCLRIYEGIEVLYHMPRNKLIKKKGGTKVVAVKSGHSPRPSRKLNIRKEDV